MNSVSPCDVRLAADGALEGRILPDKAWRPLIVDKSAEVKLYAAFKVHPKSVQRLTAVKLESGRWDTLIEELRDENAFNVSTLD